MKDFIKRLNKYVILMIISSLFGMPWFYLRFLIFEYKGSDSFVESIPTIIIYTIRLIVIILLIIDFRKRESKKCSFNLYCYAVFSTIRNCNFFYIAY